MPESNRNRFALCASLALLVAVGEVLAQRELAPVTRTEPNTGRMVDPEQRAEEFRRLAEDVAALEPQLGVFKRVARLVTPSVVHIEAQRTTGRRSRSDEQEAGSGVIVRYRENPYVLTNRHVIRNSTAARIQIQLADGATLKPEKTWSDPRTDVAVMSIREADLERVELVPAVVGDSKRLEIGEQVLAFGSPFGLSQSVTRGILSAKGRYNLDLGEGEVELQNFLQTDAAINPGNSGGPLVNLRGEVIGLNTAIASSSGGNEGIGFSIPVNLATRIAGQLIDRGEATRGFLGIEWERSFSSKGARITKVVRDSPAERAALRVNDVVIQFGGIPIKDGDHLYNLVNLSEAGRSIEVRLLRNGKVVPVMLEIGVRSGD